MTPVATSATPPAQLPRVIVRTYILRAWPDGGTLIQWYSHSLQRLQRTWLPTGFSLARPAPQLAPPLPQVYIGTTAWTEDTTLGVGGALVTRTFYMVGCSQGKDLPGLKADDYETSESDTRDAILSRYNTKVKPRFTNPATAELIELPPPPAGITLFGDHDPQQNSRKRELFKPEKLTVDTDFDSITDDVEYNEANQDPYNNDGAVPTVPGDPTSAVIPGSAGNGVPNEYEHLSHVPYGVILNEVRCSDDSQYLDEDKKATRWIEIYNPTAAAVDLDGWQITFGTTLTFTFPPPSDAEDKRSRVAEHGYLLMLGKDTKLTTVSVLSHHADFQFEADGSTVALHRPVAGGGMELRDEFRMGVTPRYGPQPPKFSFGRAADSLHAPGQRALTWGFFTTSTRGKVNASAWVKGFCSTPIITAQRGSNGTPLTPGLQSRARGEVFTAAVTGGSVEEEEVIHYTVNAAEPTTWSAIPATADGRIDLSADTPFDPSNPQTAATGRGFIIRARCFRMGFLPSPIVTRSYLFKEDVLGRPADTAGPAEPPQTRPPGYPERAMVEIAPVNGEEPHSVVMQYGVQPSVAAANRSQLATDLSAAPSISIVVPVDSFFDRDTGGIAAVSAATENGDNDPLHTGWERGASMEWIFQNNDFLPINVPCGIEISGRTTLLWEQSLKRGMRLSFKSKYGASKFDPGFAVFTGNAPTLKYDELLLKNPTADSWQGRYYGSEWASYCRERWARKFMEDAGKEFTPPRYISLRSRYIHVWINGLYCGVYLLSETANDDMLDARLGSADWQIWKDGGALLEAGPGPNAAADAADFWNRMITAARIVRQVEDAGGDSEAQYGIVLGLMDVDNFIDYCLINGMMGNYDVLHNNGRMYRSLKNSHDPRMKWMIYDAEIGCNTDKLHADWTQTMYDYAGALTDNYNHCASVFRDLSYHSAFRRRFGDLAQKRLFQMTPGQEGLLAGPLNPVLTHNPLADHASQRFVSADSEFNDFRLCEYLRWGAGWNAEGSLPGNSWIEPSNAEPGNTTRSPDYTRDYFLPKRRTIYRAELISHGLYPSGEPTGITPPEVVFGTATGGMRSVTISAVQHNEWITTVRFSTDGTEPLLVPTDYGDPDPGVPGPPLTDIYYSGKGVVRSASWSFNAPVGSVLRARTHRTEPGSLPYYHKDSALVELTIPTP